MGAGALPVDAHRRRPPIPIVPVDARARDAAAARGADPDAVLARGRDGQRGPAAHPVVDTSAIDVLRTTLAPFRDAAGMDVAHVALAVDAGRAIAAQAPRTAWRSSSPARRPTATTPPPARSPPS